MNDGVDTVSYLGNNIIYCYVPVVERRSLAILPRAAAASVHGGSITVDTLIMYCDKGDQQQQLESSAAGQLYGHQP